MNYIYDPDRNIFVRIDDEPIINNNLVEVVRCKDCKHYDGSYSYPMCWRHEENVKPDDYCSFGERTEVEE